MRVRLISSIALLLLPLTIGNAQVVRAAPRNAEFRKVTGACAAFSSAPSELARSAEGQTLLRFRREVEGVASVIEQRGSTLDSSDARRMFQNQRAVDSLMTVFVRNRTVDGVTAPSITVLRGDSVINGKWMAGGVHWESMEGAIRAMRPNIDVTLRSIESQMVQTGRARALNRASPSGYLGVNLSGSQVRMVTDSGTFTAHCDYPMIESVDFGSPARKADLRAGDTVIAYNGRDVVSLTVNYPQLLVPGRTIKVRIRREGKSRELPVNVEERPAEFTEHVVRAMPGTIRPVQPLQPSGLGGPGGVFFFDRNAPMPARGTMSIIGGSVSMMVLQGAQLFVVDDEFGQTRRLEPGILVMKVIQGTPAAEAGLRAGEMIRAVNGTPVRELLPIRRVMETSGLRELKLTVSSRDSSVRILNLRW